VGCFVRGCVCINLHSKSQKADAKAISVAQFGFCCDLLAIYESPIPTAKVTDEKLVGAVEEHAMPFAYEFAVEVKVTLPVAPDIEGKEGDRNHLSSPFAVQQREGYSHAGAPIDAL
jgi:hypothetical protein